MVGDLVLGVYDGLRGAAYLVSHPRLWRWVVAPAVVAAILLIVTVGSIEALAIPWLTALAGVMPGSWAENLVQLAAGIALTILSLTIFLGLTALIAAPFNEELSESVEEILTGQAGPRFSFLRFLVDLVVGMVHAARRVIVYLVVMGLLLVVGIAVPVVGTTVAAVLGFIATARFASYDAYDAIWARRRYRYRAKVGYLRENRWRTLGMGAVIAPLLLVPGLNVIALAIGATAATLRMIEQERSRAPRVIEPSARAKPADSAAAATKS